MERTNFEISEAQRRREREEQEYRQRRRQRRMERRNRRKYNDEHKNEYRSPKKIGIGRSVENIISNISMLRIIACIAAGLIGSMILNSDGEKSAFVRDALNSALNESISVEKIAKMKDYILDIGKKENSVDIDSGEIESDYIEKMNEEDLFYINQKN